MLTLLSNELVSFLELILAPLFLGVISLWSLVSLLLDTLDIAVCLLALSFDYGFAWELGSNNYGELESKSDFLLLRKGFYAWLVGLKVTLVPFFD